MAGIPNKTLDDGAIAFNRFGLRRLRDLEWDTLIRIDKGSQEFLDWVRSMGRGAPTIGTWKMDS